MQRYRINYHWLIGVFATSLVLAVVAFFVWRWQVERKAGYFLTQAETALAEDRMVDAFDSYRKYVQLRPDEDDVKIKMANTAIEIIKDHDVTMEQRSFAFGVLDQTVRTTDDSKLRRELAEIVIGFRPQDAIGHIENLLADSPKDSELNAMLVRALFQAKDYKRVKATAFNFVGYDKKKDEFNSENALEGESDVYALLSDVLIQKDDNTDLARRVIDQMVVANPESPQAFLRKSIFLSSVGENDEAVTFLDKAYELDPKDAAILSRKGMVALFDLSSKKTEGEEKKTEEELAAEVEAKKARAEEAKTYFALGLEEHPDNIIFYRLMAQAEQRLEQSDAALKILDKGIRKLDKNRSIDLVINKIDILFGRENYSGIDREIKRLSQLNRPDLTPLIDFQRARILFRKQEWSKAAKELKRIRPLLFNRQNFQVLAGTMLGVCYESQGINDLAREAYKMVLNDYPNHRPARKGYKRVNVRMHPKQGGIELDRIVEKTLELPEAEQDWVKVNELVEEVIVEKELGESRANLLRAKVLIKRGMYKGAKELIRQAAKDSPDDIDVHFTAIFLVASDPEQGSAVAMKLLDRLEKKWGPSLRSIAQRADLLVSLRPEDVAEQLRALETHLDDLPEADRLRLDKVLGLKFEQLGKLDDAREYYERSMAQEPNNLPIRMHLFELALRQQDDAAMQKAQAAVLEFVKSEQDPSYILTEVKRRIMSFGRREIDQEKLAEARGLLDSALRQRGEWHELHIAYGQLELLLGGDIDRALRHFDQALESGPAKSNAVRIQVKLLAERGLYAQARERMDLLHKEIRGQLLGRLEAEVLVRTGDVEAGFVAAEKLATSQATIPATQIWFSKIAQEIGKLDVAAAALRDALEMNPSDPDNWLRLIGLYAEQRKFKAVEIAIREAHLFNEAEFLPLLMGKYYELLSRWQNAESIYVAAYADRLDNLAVSRRLADFYLLWSSKDQANLGKAAVHINRILRAANEGKVTADNVHVVWARQKAARIFLAKNDYQQSLKAESLLRQSATNNRMSDAESELLVDILISRNDPQSLMQAKQLLSELRTQSRLPKKGALQLARILSKTNKWEASKSLLLELLVKYSNDPIVQTTYIDLLIDQGEYSGAENRIKRLKKINPTNGSLVQLSARLASERGDQAGLEKLLISHLPNMRGAMTPAQLKTTLGIAQLANLYGAYELAGKLFKVYVDRVPSQAFLLARFLAYHGDCDQALLLMKRLYADQTDDVIQLANRMISARRDEFGDKYDESVDRLINAALRDDPDSVSRILARAEAYETQGKNDESIAAYDRILERDDLPVRVRAAAMNNLGFQLGLLNQRVDEAEQLIDEAMQTFGPVEDMLDTRAIVRIAQEKYDLAIEDMKLALSVSQDPIKYFHLAKACILAGDGPAALKAWEKAQELGFEKNSLPRLEKAGFEQILRQIESFQSQNAKL